MTVATDEELDEIRAKLRKLLEPPPAPAVGFKFLSLSELETVPEPPNYLIEALDICPGRPTQIAGTGFAGKTIAAESAILSIITGERVWGEFVCRKGPCVHLDYEMGRRATLRRYRKLCNGMGIDWLQVIPWLKLAPLPHIYLNSAGVENDLKRCSENAAFVLVDSLRRALPGEDENDSKITSFIDAMTRASEVTGACFMLLHHSTTKTKSLEGQDARGAGRGTSAIFDASGAVLVMTGKKGEPVTVSQTKAPERGVPHPDFSLVVENVNEEAVRVVYRHLERPAELSTEDQLLGFIRTQSSGCNVSVIRKAFPTCSGSKRSAALKTLVEGGEVGRRGDPRAPIYYPVT